MQRKTQIALITSGFLMLAVLVSTGLWVKGLQSQASSLAWGGPSLHVSEPATGDIDDAHLQWIHLENLALQANQETDFRMTIREAPVNAPTPSRVQVRR